MTAHCFLGLDANIVKRDMATTVNDFARMLVYTGSTNMIVTVFISAPFRATIF